MDGDSTRVRDDDSQRLIDQYTELARLAGALAHEIKNPLSTIRLNLELLAEDFVNSENPRERRALNRIQIVQRECERLQSILDDFLKFTRADRLNLEPANLNEEIRRALQFYAARAREANIRIMDFLASNLPTVLLDRAAFQTALQNLLINALQAMPQGGELVVRTVPSPEGVVIDLIDNGCGMDPETLAHAFDAFFTTKRGGTGLGLPTARRIIEAHGGSITAQSEVGRGTQITIKLPIPRQLPGETVARDERASQSPRAEEQVNGG
ncbi:MAG: hypothetical protein KatS3mg112_0043 [Thermogutta sp.]|nr:MAG: hypothetical protein KatS3mg112_0043 [Thermogutta sp.]